MNDERCPRKVVGLRAQLEVGGITLLSQFLPIENKLASKNQCYLALYLIYGTISTYSYARAINTHLVVHSYSTLRLWYFKDLPTLWHRFKFWHCTVATQKRTWVSYKVAQSVLGFKGLGQYVKLVSNRTVVLSFNILQRTLIFWFYFVYYKPIRR